VPFFSISGTTIDFNFIEQPRLLSLFAMDVIVIVLVVVATFGVGIIRIHMRQEVSILEQVWHTIIVVDMPNTLIVVFAGHLSAGLAVFVTKEKVSVGLAVVSSVMLAVLFCVRATV